MSSSDYAVRVRGVGKRYVIAKGQTEEDTLAATLAKRLRSPFARAQTESFWALSELDFDVKRGEVVGVIGRNGAGKSTLLKVLSQITEPTTGEIEIYGRVGSLLEVGTGFHPELTGRENIFLNGAILGMRKSEIKRQFDAILDFSGVGKFVDTPVKRYSSGMYVRLAFAVAAHLETEILIVDEVLAVGDADFQRKCMGKMKDVSAGGRTVLFVSHSMNSIKTLCGSCIYLSGGKLVKTGPTDVVVDAYMKSGQATNQASWVRETDPSGQAMTIRSVECEVVGRQPAQRLKVGLTTRSYSDHPPCFGAVDIVDNAGTSIMQALPTLERVIPCSIGSDWHGEIEIDLPPMIPGMYGLTVWVGSHNTHGMDEVRNVVSFEVVDSPTPGRTFPHTADHGCIVPNSRISAAATQGRHALAGR